MSMTENDLNWFAFLETRLYTILKFRLKKVYPNINYSCGTAQNTKAAFPAWHMIELEQAERGADLTNETVNAVYETIQVDIATNGDYETCREISTQTTLEFKKLHFNISMPPTITKTGNVVTSIARYSRVIGNGELQKDTM